MNIKTIERNGQRIAVVPCDGVCISDLPSALDFMATVQYEGNCDRAIIRKVSIAEDFFNLRTGLAGSILQKFVTYRFKLAIVGDFSVYNSKALSGFIAESNRGRDIFFIANESEAIEKLGNV